MQQNFWKWIRVIITIGTFDLQIKEEREPAIRIVNTKDWMRSW